MTRSSTNDDAIGRAAIAFALAHPRDTARHLEREDAERVAAFLAGLRAAAAARVLAALNHVFANRCLTRLEPAQAAAIVSELEVQRAATLLRLCSKEERTAMVRHLDERKRRSIQRRMRYEPGSAAFLADASYPALAGDVTVKAARERFSVPATKYLYVCDRDQRLQGVLAWRDLVEADERATLGSLMTAPVERAAGGTPSAALHKHPAFAEYDALPVVDEAGTYLGAVTHKALRDTGPGKAAAVPAVGALAVAELYWRGMGALLAGLAPDRETPERAS